MTSGSCVPPILLPEHALVARRLIRAWVLTAIIFLALFLTWGYLPLDAVRPFGGSAFGASLPFQPTSSEAMFTFHGWETTLGFGPISLPAWFLLVCSLALTFLIYREEGRLSRPGQRGDPLLPLLLGAEGAAGPVPEPQRGERESSGDAPSSLDTASALSHRPGPAPHGPILGRPTPSSPWSPPGRTRPRSFLLERPGPQAVDCAARAPVAQQDRAPVS